MPDCESGCTPLKGIFFQFHSLFHGEEDDGEEPSLEIVFPGTVVLLHMPVSCLWKAKGPTSQVMNCRVNFEQGEKSGSKQQPWMWLCCSSSRAAAQGVLRVGTSSEGLTKSDWEEGNYKRIKSMEKVKELEGKF